MSRSKPSHIPLFVDSYIADTRHLTAEQDGANLRLLMAAWLSSDCSLPDDERRLAGIVGITVARWRKISGPVLELWTRECGRIWQKRLRQEWAYVREKSGKRKAAANARWSSESDANAFQVQCTYGEGGGVGVRHTQGEESLGGVSHAREARGGFTVIGGGAR